MTDELKNLVRLKWLFGQVLALLSLWTVAGLDMARGPVWVAVVLVTLVVTMFPALPGKISPSFRKVGTPILILLFIGDVIMSGRDLIPPLIRLLLILLAVRVAMVRRSREDLQLVLLAMFLSVVSGVFTLSILFALQSFFFVIATIGLLYFANLLASTEDTTEASGEWDEFTWREFASYLRDAITWRVARSMVGLLALLLLTTGLLFVAIPRVYLDQAIPFMRLSQAGLAGFNDTVRLGEVTEIQQDDGIALRVDVPGIESLPANPYWRMLILDRYQSGAFVNSLFYSADSDRNLPQIHTISPYPTKWFEQEEVSKGTWTFFLEGGVSRYLPVLGPFASMTFQGRQPLQADPQVLVFRIPEATTSVFSYQVEDFLIKNTLPGSILDRPLQAGEEPENRVEENRYPFTTLGLPLEAEEIEYLQTLIGTILYEEDVSPVQKAEKILAYLQRTHTYTLSPGGFGEGDPVVEWLKTKRPGHCELFAAAFTLLARTANIPTRMVVGFSGGSWNSYENYFVVRNRNAHAWCEIFDGSGWIRFDPTPGGSGSGGTLSGSDGEITFSTESDFQAWIDSLRVMWYRRVINFDDSSQEEVISGLTDLAKDLGAGMKAWTTDAIKQVMEWARSMLDTLKHSATAWVALVGGLLFLVSLVWFFARGPGYFWFRYKRGGNLDPLRKRAGRELVRLEALADVPAEKEAHKSELREELLAVRFGPSPDPTEALQLFRQVRGFLRGK